MGPIYIICYHERESLVYDDHIEDIDELHYIDCNQSSDIDGPVGHRRAANCLRASGRLGRFASGS